METLFSQSLLVVLCLAVFGLAYALVATPYWHKADNIRLFAYRVLVLALCGVLVGFKMTMK